MNRRSLFKSLTALALAPLARWLPKPEPEWVKMGFIWNPGTASIEAVIDGTLYVGSPDNLYAITGDTIKHVPTRMIEYTGELEPTTTP